MIAIVEHCGRTNVDGKLLEQALLIDDHVSRLAVVLERDQFNGTIDKLLKTEQLITTCQLVRVGKLLMNVSRDYDYRHLASFNILFNSALMRRASPPRQVLALLRK
jgi:hypothetical protein